MKRIFLLIVRLYNQKIYILIFSCLYQAAPATAQEADFPVPSGNPNELFYLQHSPNANTVVYELNYKKGVLDKEEPVHPYWMKYADKGEKTELNGLQRDFAYGIKATLLSPDNYQLHFAGYKKAELILKKDPEGKFAVYTMINDKPAILHKIYLQIDGGSFLAPNIEYAEFTGTDISTGNTVTEKIPLRP